MSDNLRNILDAAITQRPKEFSRLMADEVGKRIVDKINNRYENTFIDQVDDTNQDEEEDDFGIDTYEDDFDGISPGLFGEDDINEAKQAEKKTHGDRSTDLTKKQGMLSQTRDPAQKGFTNKHHVKKTDDANGNGDDVFNATNVSSVERQPMHGYNPGEDVAVYEDTIVERKLSDSEIEKRGKIADSMMDDPKVVEDFKERYGKEWKSVLMAVATKQAKK